MTSFIESRLHIYFSYISLNIDPTHKNNVINKHGQGPNTFINLFIIWEIGIRYESLLSYLSLLVIFKAILFYMLGCLLCVIRVLYMLPKDCRRECWVPRNGHYRVGIGFMCAGNWTPALWKSSPSSRSLNHLFISTKYKSISLPSFVFS